MDNMTPIEDSTISHAIKEVKHDNYHDEVSATEKHKSVQKKEEIFNKMDESEIICDNFNPEFFGLLTDPGVIRFDTVDYIDICSSEDEIQNMEQINGLKLPLICGLLNSKARKISISLNDINISCC